MTALGEYHYQQYSAFIFCILHHHNHQSCHDLSQSNKKRWTRRAASVSNSKFFYKTKGLRVKDGEWMMEGEGWRVKDVGWRMGGGWLRSWIKVKGWRVVNDGQSYFKNQFPVSESSWHLIFLPSQVHPKGVVDGWRDVFQILSSWVEIRLHTEFELPMLPASTTFWWGCDCDCCDCDCDGVKTKSTPSLFHCFSAYIKPLL